MPNFLQITGIRPLFIGLLCIAVWQLELQYTPMPNGWINGSFHSLWLLVPIICWNYLLPITREKQLFHKVAYLLLLSIASAATFFIARHAFFLLYEIIPSTISYNSLVAQSIWFFMGLCFLISSIFYLPVWHLHKDKHPSYIFTLMIVFINIIPFSLICLDMTPLNLVPHSDNFYEAVKIGYPCLLTPIFTGTFSQLISNRK